MTEKQLLGPAAMLSRIATGVIGIFFLSATCAAQQNSVSASRLLQAYARALEVFDHCEFNVTAHDYFQGGVFRDEAEIVTATWFFRRKDPQWKILYSAKGIGVHRNKTTRFDITTEFVTPDRGSVYVQKENGDLAVTAELSRTSPATSPAVYLDVAAAALGILPGDNLIQLPDLLKASKLDDSAEEMIDGSQVYRLTGKGVYGTHTVWIDPAIGYLARRVRTKKAGSDLSGTNAVSSYMPSKSRDGGLYPNLAIQEIITSCDYIKFDRAGGDYYPKELEVRTHWHYVGGTMARLRTVVSIDNFKRNSGTADAHAFTVETVIPDGTDVYVEDAPNIVYVWEGKGIRKKVATDTVSSLDRVSFQGASRSSRTWTIILNVCAIAIILAVLYRRRFLTNGRQPV